jgi:hypothetical protein
MESGSVDELSPKDVVLTAPKAALKEKVTLQDLVNCGCINETSRDWLIASLDPMHDTPLSVRGLPDLNTGNSLVQCVRQTATINKPNDSVAAANWDVNIVMFPVVDWESGHDKQWNTSDYYAWLETDTITVAPYKVGGVGALASSSGVQTYGNSSAAQVQEMSGGLNCPESFLNGSSRVIAMGFEVVNTTSPLNRQGLVTTWRQPTPTIDTEYVSRETTLLSGTGFVTTYPFTQPPGSLEAAMLLAGSKTWEAEKGAYCVSTMNRLDNPAKQMQAVSVLSLTSDIKSEADVADVGIGQGYEGTGDFLVQPRHIAPYNMSGAYFTGLSAQTTLQVTAIYYIERFPNPTEADLVVLAAPSAGYDSEALEIYAKLSRDLQTGVPSGMNPAGEWFESILNKVATVAAPVLKELGSVVPFGGALTRLAEGVRDVTAPSLSNQNIRARSRAKKKKARRKARAPSKPTRTVGRRLTSAVTPSPYSSMK